MNLENALVPGSSITMQPSAEAIYRERRRVESAGRPSERSLPHSIPDAIWMGSSIGKWEGDTFVVETRGFNDQSWLDDFGHLHSEALMTTERFHRTSIGEMEVSITIDDPQSYTKPWTVKINLHLLPDTDLIEDVCDNEKDNVHTTK